MHKFYSNIHADIRFDCFETYEQFAVEDLYKHNRWKLIWISSLLFWNELQTNFKFSAFNADANLKLR
jgi:hypothetical protein